jgi:hypothetical protein
VALAKQNMLKVIGRRHADKHHRDEQFAVGDEVRYYPCATVLAADKSQHRAANDEPRFIQTPLRSSSHQLSAYESCRR